MVLQRFVLVLAGMASLAKGRAVTEPPTESHSHCQPSCKQCTPQPIHYILDLHAAEQGTTHRSLARDGEFEWGRRGAAARASNFKGLSKAKRVYLCAKNTRLECITGRLDSEIYIICTVIVMVRMTFRFRRSQRNSSHIGSSHILFLIALCVNQSWEYIMQRLNQTAQSGFFYIKMDIINKNILN